MSTRASSGFGIHAFDSTLRVQCSSSELLDLLNRYVFPPLHRCTSIPDQPDIDLALEESPNGIDILLDGKRASTEVSPTDALLSAVKALDEAVVHNLKRHQAVHAGAVLIQGRALLIPGLTHAGKSSLVAELLRSGAGCFSDEYALIANDGLVHPYPRPLLLRNGSPRQALVLPEELGSIYALHPAPVGWIVAVNYEPEGEFVIHSLPQSEAVMLLLRNTPHEMSQSPGLVDCFVRAAANAICYQGSRGDAKSAAAHILDLVQQREAPSRIERRASTAN
jgi:hypothetical protein